MQAGVQAHKLGDLKSAEVWVQPDWWCWGALKTGEKTPQDVSGGGKIKGFYS